MTLNIQSNYSLMANNSLSVPAVCDGYIEITSALDMVAVVEEAMATKQSIFVLGEGTNIVLAGDYPGLVVRPNILGRQILSQDKNQVELRVGAGENWHQLVSWTLAKGYFGLENLALIPGSCGAAPVQNIGAYGVELSRFISAVHYFDFQTASMQVLTNQQCQFAYRDSIFKHDLKDLALITHIDLVLPFSASVCLDYPVLAEYLRKHCLESTAQNIFEAVCALRSSKLPDVSQLPNVGSFFKNPIVQQADYQRLQLTDSSIPGYPQPDNQVKIPAAWLIDRLGWKGKSENGVGVHSQHALVIVNSGHCSGDRVLEFAARIQADVAAQFGIQLEIEPRIIGL